MRETPRDNMWGENSQEVKAEPVSGGPSETELVQVALLMRLYDLNLALLSHFDSKRANEVYAAHEKGEHFNPPVYIPEVPED